MTVQVYSYCIDVERTICFCLLIAPFIILAYYKVALPIRWVLVED